MLDALRLYGRYAAISIRGEMQYRASFVMTMTGQFLIAGVEFLAIWALFDRFGSLAGWRLAEVALLYGMAGIAFAIADTLGRGFDLFGGLVKSGDFDRLMLRPRSTVFQVAAQGVRLVRFGRFAQGALVLGWSLFALDVVWTPERIVLLAAGIVAGAATFFGLLVLQATLSFWTTEGLEIANVVTYGGVEAAQYPLPIYDRWFRGFFLFVVPLACMNYFPALAITGHADPLGFPVWLPWLSPLVGPLFLAFSLWVWGFGVRHYRSTGS